MSGWHDIKAFRKLGTEVRHSDVFRNKPKNLEALPDYFSYMVYSWQLAFKEKEIFLFIFLQWLSIAFGYYLFAQMLFWIPQSVWDSVEKCHGRHCGSAADLVLFLWMFICIGVTALPISIFSSCMSVVHLIHYWQERSSSIAECLQIVLPRTWTLWIFYWFDNYTTVSQIIERLPKKDEHRNSMEIAISESVYYAWKLTTMGIVPNLIVGRPLGDVAKNTLGIIKEHGGKLIRIRAGYSLLCWCIAVPAYFLGGFWAFNHADALAAHFFPGLADMHIAKFYFCAGIPLLVVTAIIEVFVRPAYVLALTDIYAQYMSEKKQDILPSEPPPAAISALVFGAFLCLTMAAVYLYRDQLGVTALLAEQYHLLN